jgi:hypothetical protein
MLAVALAPPSMARNYKMTTPIAPGVATPNHLDRSIGPLIYDNQTRSMLQTDQHAPSVSSLDPGLKINSDGSVDVYFGPTAPAGAANWIQTTRARS